MHNPSVGTDPHPQYHGIPTYTPTGMYVGGDGDMHAPTSTSYYQSIRAIGTNDAVAIVSTSISGYRCVR